MWLKERPRSVAFPPDLEGEGRGQSRMAGADLRGATSAFHLLLQRFLSSLPPAARARWQPV